jgi:hypothetical protein
VSNAAKIGPAGGTVTAPCPAGQKVLGGGYSMVPAPAAGLTIYGDGPGGAGTSWQVDVVNHTTATETVTAYAICANPS